MSGEVRLHAICCDAVRAADEIRGVWDAGDAVMVLNPKAPKPEIDRLLGQVAPSYLHDGTSVRTLRGGKAFAEEIAAVAASSGTSGVPKLVELTKAGLVASAEAVSGALSLRDDDVWLCCVPVHFVAGLAIVARAWWTGAGLVVHDGFSVDAVAEAAGRNSATIVSLVPTMLSRLLTASAPLSFFRHVLIGGGPLPLALADEAQRSGVRYSMTYGLTETFGGAVHDGHPLAGVEVQLAADGEIRLRGPMVMRGYHNDPDRTALVLSAEGWLSTGDLGEIDGGVLKVKGRKGDLINTGGVKVSPSEVEEALLTHPLVKDLCVKGEPDEEFGEQVVAYVVAKGSGVLELSELRRHGAQLLSREKLPRRLVLIDEVPRSPSGKVLRRLLGGP